MVDEKPDSDRRTDLGAELQARSPKKSKTAPVEEIGPWELAPNGVWSRIVRVSSECFSVEFATDSQEHAQAIADALNARPTPLGIARQRMSALAVQIEASLSGLETALAADVRALIYEAREVERLFECEARMEVSARMYESWEKKSAIGAQRIRKDPEAAKKDRAKAGAKKLWLERHAGKHRNLRTVSQFAIEVMRRWPELRSAKVIEGWSAQWTKEAKNKPPVS